MPAPKPATKKTAQPKPKKPSKKEQEEQALRLQKEQEDRQKRRRFFLGYGLGFLALLSLVLAFIPGQNAWLAMHNWLWGFAGITLLPSLAVVVFLASVPVRNRKLSQGWYIPLSQYIMILFFGAAVFLVTRSKELLAEEDWIALATACFDRANPDKVAVGEILRNGGLFASMLGAALAKAAGKAAALWIALLVFLACIPIAVPGLYETLLGGFARNKKNRREVDIDTDTQDETPYETPKRGRPPKAGRAAQRDELMDELDRIAEESGGVQVSGGRKQAAGVPPTSGISTVMDFEPLTPEPSSLIPDTAAGNLALGLGGGKKQKSAQLAGKDIAKENRVEAEPVNTFSTSIDQSYTAPSITLLEHRASDTRPLKGEEDRIAQALETILSNFGVSVVVTDHNRGPAVTRYEIKPAEGVKISKITSLADDIALHLAATKVRIEAPIPGKPAIGVEIPNSKRAIVSLREVIESGKYRAGAAKSKLTVSLGKDIVGDMVVADLAKLPHLLIAGTTGSGKSVCMNALILSLIYNASPADVKLVMIDPKMVEFNIYSGIPHLKVPVVSDPLKAAGALGWAVNEMEKRYAMISEQNVRDIDSYNTLAMMQEDLEHLPRVVIFIDELSDLMMVAPSDVEDCIQRIAQKGRAAGIHLVVATQRPSVDVITGVIKSNLPGRIALSVASQIDSRTIINSMGAEQLLGNGDMLYSPNGGNNALRVQGCYVSDDEVKNVVKFIKEEDVSGEKYDDAAWEEMARNAQQVSRSRRKGGAGLDLPEGESEDDDPMLDAAIEVVVAAQLASTTMLQKKLKLGYARASRVVDQLEAKGIVGPSDGAKPRKVLMSHAQWQEYSAGGGGMFGGGEE